MVSFYSIQSLLLHNVCHIYLTNQKIKDNIFAILDRSYQKRKR